MLPAQHLIYGTEGGSTLVTAVAQKCQPSPRSLGQGLACGGNGSLAFRWKMFSLWLWGTGGHVAGGQPLLPFLSWNRISLTWAGSSLGPHYWWPKGPSAQSPEEASCQSASPTGRLSHSQVFPHPLPWNYCRYGSPCSPSRIKDVFSSQWLLLLMPHE